MYLIIFLIEKRKKMNKIKLIKGNVIKLIKLKLKLTKLKLKLTKLKLNKLKLNKLNTLKYVVPLMLNKTNKIKKIIFEKDKLKKKEIAKLTEELTKKAINKNYLQHVAARKKLWSDDRAEMKKAKELNKKDTDRFYRFPLNPKKTDFYPTMSYETLQRTKTFRIQKYYRDRQKRIKLHKQHLVKYKIPRKKRKKFFFSQRQLYVHQKIKKYKFFSFIKYSSFFRLLLKTRLKLFKNKKIKNNFNFLFLNKLKNSIKSILFKNKSNYYNLIQSPLDGMNF